MCLCVEKIKCPVVSEYGNYQTYKNFKWLAGKYRPYLVGLMGAIFLVLVQIYLPSNYLTVILSFILITLFAIFVEDINLNRCYFKETFTKDYLVQQRGEAINTVKFNKGFLIVLVQNVNDSNEYWIEIENPKVYEILILESTRQQKKLIIEALTELLNLEYHETIVEKNYEMQMKKIIYQSKT